MKAQGVILIAFAALLPVCGVFAATPEWSFSMKLCDTNDLRSVVEVRAAEMRKFRECESGGAKKLVWRGHPKAGADFSVTATLAPDGEGGFGYSFSYDGVADGFSAEEIRFPVVTVPRSDSTAILYPLQIGMLRKPDWGKFKDGEKVVSAGPNLVGFHFAALLDDAIGGW